MATIVQPYNPWKEQLALTALGNVAGNILSDLWQSHRQNEQNRKANAFRGQLQQDLQNNAQPEISLMPKEAPQGYNSNPWANAMHQNYTPLTAFDIGTSTVGKTPSIQDIVQGADSLAASKRFSMLSPELVQGVKNSMIQQAETQRLRDLQNNFADMFGNAKTQAEQMRALVLANIHGFGDKAMAPFSAWAVHSTPHHQYQEINAGDKILAMDFNPADGSMRQKAAVNVGINPTNKYVSDSSSRSSNYSADRSAGAHMYGSKLAADTERQKLALEQYKQGIADYDNQLKSIDNSIATYLSALEGIENENAREAYRVRYIAPLEEQKAKLTAERDALQENYRRGLGFGASQAQTTQADLGDLSYWGETSNGMGKDINGKPFDYSPIINKYGKQYGIDPDLAAAVMQWESGGNVSAISNKGAIGLFQLMPKTAQQLGVNPHDVEDNIKGGIMYLRQMLDKYNGNLELALRAYNAGPGATDAGRYPAETQKYVPGVLGIYRKLRSNRPQKKQPKAPQSSQPQQQPQTQPQNTATQTQPQTTGQPTTQGQPYLRNTETGQTLSLQEFEELRDMNHTSADDLFDALTDRGWELDNGQQNTPQLPITANSIENTENPFARPNVQDWHEPLNSAPTMPVSTGANPWSYVQQNSPPAWGSFDIHQPILGGQRQLPLPQQQTVSQDSRLSPLFSGNAINAVSDFLKGLNLTSGDEAAVIPPMHEKGFFQYTDNPIPNDPRYNPHVSFPQGLPAGNAYNPQPGEFPNNFSDKNRRNFIPDIPTGYYRGGVETRPWSLADWINRYANNENTFRPPLSALSSSQNPSNKSLRYYSGNMAGGLLPENAYNREKIDGEYQFLDPQLTALNGGLPYWYGGALSDDAYQLNFLLNSLGVTADKYPYIKRY